MPTPPTTFIPSLLGLHILLLVIVWPSAVFRASLTTPLSKHGVCAKCRHLPFAPLIQPYCVSSASSSSNSFERLVWQRFISTGKFYLFIFYFFICIFSLSLLATICIVNIWSNIAVSKVSISKLTCSYNTYCKYEH